MDKDEMHMVEEFAQWLNEISPDARAEVLHQLREQTEFCWSCGYDTDKREVCHCENDA